MSLLYAFSIVIVSGVHTYILLFPHGLESTYYEPDTGACLRHSVVTTARAVSWGSHPRGSDRH